MDERWGYVSFEKWRVDKRLDDPESHEYAEFTLEYETIRTPRLTKYFLVDDLNPIPEHRGLRCFYLCQAHNMYMFRKYFPDADNSADPILARIEHRNRVDTLIAVKTAENAYRFDIRLQGDGETIFFDF